MSTQLEPVVFGGAIEALQRAIKKELTPQLVAEVSALGIDLYAPAAGYALSTWESAIALIAVRLRPGLPPDEQHRQFGQIFMDGYVETLLGSATLAMARLLGAKRTMLRMGRNFRTVANYIECTTVEDGPNGVLLTTYMKPEYLPAHTPKRGIFFDYRRGILERTLALLGHDGSVELADRDLEQQRAVFRVQWAPK
jgi:uncharacterized protein (TIGR02265 family)